MDTALDRLSLEEFADAYMLACRTHSAVTSQLPALAVQYSLDLIREYLQEREADEDLICGRAL